MGIDELLEHARARIDRLTPEQSRAAADRGAVIVDTRPFEQRTADGVIPGAIVMSRNVLEWRVDPTSGWDDARVTGRTGPVIVMCQEGYASSLAAATLRDIGIDDAADMIGGFEAWKAAGLPVEAGSEELPAPRTRRTRPSSTVTPPPNAARTAPAARRAERLTRHAARPAATVPPARAASIAVTATPPSPDS